MNFAHNYPDPFRRAFIGINVVFVTMNLNFECIAAERALDAFVPSSVAVNSDDAVVMNV